MKVYRVRPDVNHFQYFMFENESDGLSDRMTFDGSPGKSATWVSPAVYIYKPKHRKGNFPELWGASALVVDEIALKQIRDLLEMSGELLPLSYKESMYYVVNVTECVNVLDESKTQWLYEKGSGPIKSYAFHADRFSEAPLFKIPETCRSDILTVEGSKDPDDEFKGRVERLGLTGLIFDELWSDEK